MKNVFFFIIGGLLVACNAETEPVVKETVAEISLEESSIVTIDLLELKEYLPEGNIKKIRIEKDPFFKTTKSYLAYDLKSVIVPYLEKMNIDKEGTATIKYICIDGYQPTQKVKDFWSEEGYLAFKDLDQTELEQNWPDSLQSKFMPFYLVWPEAKGSWKKWPNPYGLVAIEIHPDGDVYDPILPKNDELAMKGFETFKTYCVKCHSINKIGGQVGPELNYPKSILSYWQEQDIWNFVKSPQAYRYNAKMPAVKMLTEAEFQSIVTYLKYMQTQNKQVGLAEPL